MPTYTSQYPPVQSDTYVKATTKYSTSYWPHFATDPTKLLTGGSSGRSWFSASCGGVNQRFHIDLGTAKIIRRIYYENGHGSGGYTNRGAQNFTFWGSNTGAGTFDDLVYGNDEGWTELTVAQNTFDEHIALDQADPKYITVTNAVTYRYYAFKFADNHGDANFINVRRIELQTEDGWPPPDIDIGDSAINRANALGSYTLVNKGNPANASGQITSIEIWAFEDLINCQVATFYRPDPEGFPNNLSTRGAQAIGTVTAGAKRTFEVDFPVQAGDYIGIYYSAGTLEVDSAGGDGIWYISAADHIPCTNQLFSSAAGWKISVYGTGIGPPDPPTNVQAGDGIYTDKVHISWTKSDGATGYQVYRDGTPLGWLGDVNYYFDTGADAPTITPGTAFASDGRNASYVTLNITGESANNGTVHVYKVRARSAAGESGDSGTDTGYRGVGSLTKQWWRSALDGDFDYWSISGGTTDPYEDIGAPANGDGRYYYCRLNATGASQQDTNHDRGYRAPPGTIDIGNPGIRRGYVLSNTVVYTVVSKNNPADASGKITSVELYCSADLLDVEVATFYRPDSIGFPNNLSTRDTEYIGTVTGGGQRTFVVDLDVEVGDYIGCVASNNSKIYLDIENGDGTWYKVNDHIPCTNQLFSFAVWILSLNGIGPPVGIKWNGVIISKWNGKVISKFNGIG